MSFVASKEVLRMGYRYLQRHLFMNEVRVQNETREFESHAARDPERRRAVTKRFQMMDNPDV